MSFILQHFHQFDPKVQLLAGHLVICIKSDHCIILGCHFHRDRLSVVAGQVNLLPYHELGQDKLEKLGKERHDYGFNPPSKQHLNELVQLFNQNGYNNTKIGG